MDTASGSQAKSAKPFRSPLPADFLADSEVVSLERELQKVHAERLNNAKQAEATAEADAAVRLLEKLRPNMYVRQFGSRRGNSVGNHSDIDIFVHNEHYLITKKMRKPTETMPLILWDTYNYLKNFYSNSEVMINRHKFSTKELEGFRRAVDMIGVPGFKPQVEGKRIPALVNFRTKLFSYDVSNSIPAFLNSKLLHKLASFQNNTYAVVNLLRIVVERLGISSNDCESRGFRHMHLLALVCKMLQSHNLVPLHKLPSTKRFDKSAISQSVERFTQLQPSDLIEHQTTIIEQIILIAKFINDDQFTNTAWSLMSAENEPRKNKANQSVIWLSEPFEPFFNDRRNMFDVLEPVCWERFKKQLINVFEAWTVERDLKTLSLVAEVSEMPSLPKKTVSKPVRSKQPEFDDADEEDLYHQLERLWTFEGSEFDYFASFSLVRQRIAYILIHYATEVDPLTTDSLIESYRKVFKSSIPYDSEYGYTVKNFLKTLNGDILVILIDSEELQVLLQPSDRLTRFLAKLALDDMNEIYLDQPAESNSVEDDHSDVLVIDEVEPQSTDQRDESSKDVPVAIHHEMARISVADVETMDQDTPSSSEVIPTRPTTTQKLNYVTPSESKKRTIDERFRFLQSKIETPLNQLIHETLSSMSKLDESSFNHLTSSSDVLMNYFIDHLQNVYRMPKLLSSTKPDFLPSSSSAKKSSAVLIPSKSIPSSATLSSFVRMVSSEAMPSSATMPPPSDDSTERKRKLSEASSSSHLSNVKPNNAITNEPLIFDNFQSLTAATSEPEKVNAIDLTKAPLFQNYDVEHYNLSANVMQSTVESYAKRFTASFPTTTTIADIELFANRMYYRMRDFTRDEITPFDRSKLPTGQEKLDAQQRHRTLQLLKSALIKHLKFVYRMSRSQRKKQKLLA